MKLLVVCLGNICRSPMAEGILRKKIEEKKLLVEVDSAGTANYHVGEHPDFRAISAARKYNVDISGLRARQFAKTDFDRFDRIYAMDASNYKNILSLARSEEDKNKVYYFLLNGNEGMNVPDPWFGDDEGFYPVFELLERAADKILAEIEEEVRS
jgi:protein-tyrosine phosphatase